jgi:hypothetical protein
MASDNKIAKKIDSILRTLVWYCKPVIRKCIRTPVIIFRMDGGTCSQIVDYVSMKMLEDQGYPMRMDVSWYDRYGEGKDSVIARPYNIDKLFELKKFKTVGKFQSWLYQVLFSYFPPEEMRIPGDGVNLTLLKMPEAPSFLQGYYRFPRPEIEKNLGKYCTLKSSEEILDEENLQIFREIAEVGISVGVHVRRGDMASEGGYWDVLPSRYFINLCEDLNGEGVTFFFFSEEPQWIRENIIPYVDIRWRIVNNSAYDGYKDLYLLSRCRYQVCSQGSFGAYAYMMNENTDRKMIVYDKNNPRLWKWSSDL